MSLEAINQLKQRKATLSIETKKLFDEETNLLLLIQQHWEREVQKAEQEYAKQQAKLKLLIDNNREVVDLILKNKDNGFTGKDEPTIEIEVMEDNDNYNDTTYKFSNTTEEAIVDNVIQLVGDILDQPKPKKKLTSMKKKVETEVFSENEMFDQFNQPRILKPGKCLL